MAGLQEGKQETDELVQLAVERAANFYEVHRLCCSESVIIVMNQGFGGGLPAEVALRMGAGFCHGMGGAGCSCGALSGAVAALGLFLGPHGREGFRKKRFQQIIRAMHDRFRERFRSTCCRVLTRKVRQDDMVHRANCLELTRGGAEIAVQLLLEARPDLIGKADRSFLVSREAIG